MGSALSSRKGLDDAEFNSVNDRSLVDNELMLKVAFEVGVDGEGKREAHGYLRHLKIAAFADTGAPKGWGYLQVRCQNATEAKETPTRLLTPPESGENPITAIGAEALLTNGVKIKFEKTEADFFHLYAIFGIVPVLPLGGGAFVLELDAKWDMEKIASKCADFNRPTQTVKPQIMSVTQRPTK